MTASGDRLWKHIITPPLSTAVGLTLTGRGPPRRPQRCCSS